TCSVLAVRKPATSSADDAIKNFILISLGLKFPIFPREGELQCSPLKVQCEDGDGPMIRIDTDQAPLFIEPRRHYSDHQRFCSFPPSLPPAVSVIRNTSKITAVDQPNSSTPFIAVIGPSKCQRTTGVTSP